MVDGQWDRGWINFCFILLELMINRKCECPNRQWQRHFQFSHTFYSYPIIILLGYYKNLRKIVHFSRFFFCGHQRQYGYRIKVVVDPDFTSRLHTDKLTYRNTVEVIMLHEKKKKKTKNDEILIRFLKAIN